MCASAMLQHVCICYAAMFRHDLLVSALTCAVLVLTCVVLVLGRCRAVVSVAFFGTERVCGSGRLCGNLRKPSDLGAGARAR